MNVFVYLAVARAETFITGGYLDVFDHLVSLEMTNKGCYFTPVAVPSSVLQVSSSTLRKNFFWFSFCTWLPRYWLVSSTAAAPQTQAAVARRRRAQCADMFMFVRPHFREKTAVYYNG